MPQQNTQVLEILLCQIADDREVNGVGGEALGVLGQAELFEPVRDLLHRDSASYWIPPPESVTTPSACQRVAPRPSPNWGLARCACPSMSVLGLEAKNSI